ncbi:hypothetical protein FACS1894196_0170 [Clostridia bacterium]|nr:hypothetical protein FACS1894196_0170 [Clostridia bacterium]
MQNGNQKAWRQRQQNVQDRTVYKKQRERYEQFVKDYEDGNCEFKYRKNRRVAVYARVNTHPEEVMKSCRS